MNELEAINIMLLNIGEQQVEDLNSDYEELVLAKSVLNKTIKSVLNKGYNFNLEKDYNLLSDINGEISLPTNALRVEFNDNKYVKRGNKVYDSFEKTFNINKDIKADIYIYLLFDDIPFVAQNYISKRASRIFQQQIVGDNNIYRINIRDEQEAFDELFNYDLENYNYNFLSNSDISNRKK